VVTSTLRPSSMSKICVRHCDSGLERQAMKGPGRVPVWMIYELLGSGIFRSGRPWIYAATEPGILVIP
jgi:hypothetical protein